METHVLPGQVFETVVGLIWQQRFDLLVVGFMIHSRLYERIIGGTTSPQHIGVLHRACG
jgi:hypothetical protein